MFYIITMMKKQTLFYRLCNYDTKKFPNYVLMSEFRHKDTLAKYVFWLMTEKKHLIVKVLVSNFVFWYFYILFVSVA